MTVPVRRLLFLSLAALIGIVPAHAEDKAPAASEPAAAPSQPPPLPFHTIEGYGGGAITPIAYLVNPPPEGQTLGLPAAAFSYVSLADKSLIALTLTETLLGRFELGIGADQLSLGTLPGDIQGYTGVNIGTNSLWLNSFNLRVLALPENSFDLPLPALTTGVQFKYNYGIDGINDSLGGALNTIGYQRPYGADFTLTATKAIIIPEWERPLILSAGGRGSDSNSLGFLGFGNRWSVTFEGNVVLIPIDNWVVAYEFRQNGNSYGTIPPLLRGVDNWNAFDISYMVGSHIDIVAGYGIFGNIANTTADSAWWLHFKYEL